MHKDGFWNQVLVRFSVKEQFSAPAHQLGATYLIARMNWEWEQSLEQVEVSPSGSDSASGNARIELIAKAFDLLGPDAAT